MRPFAVCPSCRARPGSLDSRELFSKRLIGNPFTPYVGLDDNHARMCPGDLAEESAGICMSMQIKKQQLG